MSTQNNPTEKIAAQPFMITREFPAPRELVWKAWTEPERMRQWFGPKGFTGTTVKLDLRAACCIPVCVRRTARECGVNGFSGK